MQCPEGLAADQARHRQLEQASQQEDERAGGKHPSLHPPRRHGPARRGPAPHARAARRPLRVGGPRRRARGIRRLHIGCVRRVRRGVPRRALYAGDGSQPAHLAQEPAPEGNRPPALRHPRAARIQRVARRLAHVRPVLRLPRHAERLLARRRVVHPRKSVLGQARRAQHSRGQGDRVGRVEGPDARRLRDHLAGHRLGRETHRVRGGKEQQQPRQVGGRHVLPRVHV